MGKLLWFHRLANGHRVALTVQDVELTTFARETMRSKREVGLEGFLRDLESGGIELPEAPGRHGFSVLHALPPVGHLVTVLEFKGISYWAPGD